MAPPTAYITPDDLRTALGQSTYEAVFDDDNHGNVDDDDAGVLLVIERAHAEVTSYLPNLYTNLPESIPTLLKSAELDFAVALSFERHPEYVRSFGEEKKSQRWLRAETKMGRIADSIQRLVDIPTKPANVGGSASYDGQRIAISNPDGTPNAGDW